MFASLMRASAGDDRSPFGDFWFSPVGSRTAAGARVTPDTALRLSTVYACVRVLAESFAVLPFKLYRPRAGGRGRELVKQHWLVRLFTKRPNQLQNPFEWREMLQGHLALRGNAYCRIVEDGQGGISELQPLHPDRITVEALSNGSWRYRYVRPDGSTEYLARDQVWHIRGLSSDGISGVSPIDLQRDVIGSSTAMQDYAARFFLNDAKPTGGWIEYPGKINNDATRDHIKDSVKKATGGANRHKTMVLDSGMKYHEVGVTNKDSQFLEARQFSRTEICAIFRVAPHMVGDLTRATFSNIEQQSIDHWMGTMLPWTERWEAAIEALLGEDSDLEVEFDFRNLLRGDAASRSQYIHNLVLDGVITRNEGRELEGYDPLEGLDEPLVPVNERGLNDPVPGDQPAEPPKPEIVQTSAPDDGAGDETAQRLAQLVGSNASRLARRFARAEIATMDAELIADALAVDLRSAQAWLAAVGNAAMTEDTLRASLQALGSTT